MKQTFLTLPRPFVCALLSEKGLGDTIAQVHNADFAGADAVGVDMRGLADEEKTVDKLSQVMESTVRPILAMQYRCEEGGRLTDEERAEYLLRAARAGASIVDVMGDLFDPSEREYSRDRAAIRKQKELIEAIHDAGCAVVMSSHMQVSRTAGEVVDQLKDFEDRGADVVKIVPQVNTEAEMREAFETMMRLRHELTKPYIYVAGGRFGRHQRAIAPMFGSMLSFGQFPAHCVSPVMFQSPVRR